MSNLYKSLMRRSIKEKQINKRKRDELFVRHHIENYNGKFPIWVAIEIFSFGMLSKFFSNLKKKPKDYISKHYYRFPPEYTTSWLHSLANLRNICAHYGRLYNRHFALKPPLGNKDKRLGIQQDRLFAIIFVLKYLINDERAWDDFIANLEALFERYDSVDKTLIGFPINWVALLKQ